MDTKIARWGNSLAVRIPSGMAQDMALVEGARVRIDLEGDRLVLQPTGRRITLSALIAGIDEDNLHGETDWGGQEGSELW